MAGEIFISYRRTRDGVAARLESVLHANGFAEYQVFRDVRGLFAGEGFERQLADTLQRTKVVLLLLGEGDAPSLDADDWVARELRAAMVARRPIVPVTLLPGGEREAAAGWPKEFAPILETQFLTFSDPATNTEVRRMCGALRRLGVRPLDTVEQWRSILLHNPVDDVVARVQEVTRSRSGLALVRGATGAGRTHVIERVAANLRDGDGDGDGDAPRSVGLHRGLQSRLVGVDGAAMYDWIEGAVASAVHIPDCVLDLTSCGLSPRHLPRTVVDRLNRRQRRRLTDSDLSIVTQGMAQGSLAILESLAAQQPLVLLCDDIDLADSGTQEIVRVLADRLAGPRPPAIVLVLAATSSSLLDLFTSSLPKSVVIDLEPDVRTMLRGSGQVDEPLADELVNRQFTPAQCAIYLQYLHEHGLLTRVDGTATKFGLAPNAQLPALATVLDAELDSILPSSLQQILEIGALCGARFPVSVADRVAGAGAAGDGVDDGDAVARLLSYDQDGLIVLPAADVGRDRLAFASSMWWQHLRARRVTPSGKPKEPALVRSLAVALGDLAATTDDRYDDWATVGFLYDSIDDNAEAGAAFLRAARAARRQRANEAASRGYKEAARRLELHAATSSPGLERAGELLRVAYCRFRAATVFEARRKQTSAGDLASRRSTDPFDATETILEAVDDELEDVASQVTATDFDDVVIHGSDVNAETIERLKLQWRSLGAYIAVERGQRALDASPPDHERAVQAFSRALLFGEAGLSGSVYHELVVAASAGLARAFSMGDDIRPGCERAAAAVEHAARAAMTARRSPYTTSPRLPGERDRVADAGAWVAGTWQALAERLQEPSLSRAWGEGAPQEAELIDFLRAAHRAVSPPDRVGHPDEIMRLGRRLLEHAADLAVFLTDRTVLRDIEVYAHSHDQFRYTADARLLRLWRDLGGTDSRQLTDGAETDWRNPVLLHGRIAAEWLAHDLRVDRVIGEASFRRVRAAMCSHTVGASHLGGDPDATFIRLVQLADMVSARPDDERMAGIVDVACRPGGLALAYDEAFRLRAAMLKDDGRIVSSVTTAIGVAG